MILIAIAFTVCSTQFFYLLLEHIRFCLSSKSCFTFILCFSITKATVFYSIIETHYISIDRRYKEMQEVAIYEELITTQDIISYPRLTNFLHLTCDSLESDKVQASLYDKFILLKFKVPSLASRNTTKNIIGRYLSVSNSSSNYCAKNQKVNNKVDPTDYASKEISKASSSKTKLTKKLG